MGGYSKHEACDGATTSRHQPRVRNPRNVIDGLPASVFARHQFARAVALRQASRVALGGTSSVNRGDREGPQELGTNLRYPCLAPSPERTTAIHNGVATRHVVETWQSPTAGVQRGQDTPPANKGVALIVLPLAADAEGHARMGTRLVAAVMLLVAGISTPLTGAAPIDDCKISQLPACLHASPRVTNASAGTG